MAYNELVLKGEWERISGIRDYFRGDYEMYVKWSLRNGGGRDNMVLVLRYLEWGWKRVFSTRKVVKIRKKYKERSHNIFWGLREFLREDREIGYYEDVDGEYGVADLTDYEKSCIRKSLRRDISETARKYNTSEGVVQRLLGFIPQRENIRQIFRDGSYYEYMTVGSCVRERGYSSRMIYACLNGDINRYKGGKWRWVYKDNVRFKRYKEDTRNMSCKNKGRVILQMDMEENVLREWRTVKEAAFGLGISQGNISKILTGRRISLLGFKFKYK